MRINANREPWPECCTEMCGNGSATAAPHNFGRQFADLLKPRMKPIASPTAHPNMWYNVVMLHLLNDAIVARGLPMTPSIVPNLVPKSSPKYAV